MWYNGWCSNVYGVFGGKDKLLMSSDMETLIIFIIGIVTFIIFYIIYKINEIYEKSNQNDNYIDW